MSQPPKDPNTPYRAPTGRGGPGGQYESPEAYRQAYLAYVAQQRRQKNPDYRARIPERTPQYYEGMRQAGAQLSGESQTPSATQKFFEGEKLKQATPEKAPKYSALDVYYKDLEKQLQAKYSQRYSDPTQFKAYQEAMRASPVYQEVQRRSGSSAEAASFRESVAFYQNLGYPQYAGKYEPFEVPKGTTVISVKEVGSSLDVKFFDTETLRHIVALNPAGISTKEQAVASYEAQQKKFWQKIVALNPKESKEQIISTLQALEAKQKIKRQESIDFYTGLGYPQYGGKYDPLKIPNNAADIVLTETPEGLTASYKIPYTPITEQSRYGFAIQTSADFFRSIGYPQYAGKYLGFKTPEGYKIKNITETDKGLNVELIGSEVAEQGQAFDVSQLSPIEQEYLRVVSGGGAPIRSHLGPPSGYTSLPTSTIPTIIGTVPKQITREPRGAEYTGGVEKQFIGVGLAPEGYRVVSVETVKTGPLGSEIMGISPMSKGEIVTLEPISVKSTGSLFGPSRQFFDPVTGRLTDKTTGQVTVTRKTDPLYAVAAHEPSIAESKALFGAQLVTAVALPVAIMKLAPFAIGGVAVAETAKYVMSGEHLTAPEALSAASLGLIVGSTTMALAPKIQAKLQPVAQKFLTQKYLETGKVGFSEKALAKITGIKVPAKNYIISGGDSSTWTLAREEATINRALIPKGQEPVKSVSVQAWAKGTQWTKPTGVSSSLNRYLGSGQVVSLKTLQAQAPQTAVTVLKPPSQAAMLTLPIATAKTMQRQQQKTLTVVSDVLGVSWSPLSQQIVNPFIAYSGKPYYRTKQRAYEEYETLVLSYPLSGLTSPKQLTRYLEREVQVQPQIPSQTIFQSPFQEQIKIPLTVPIQTPILTPKAEATSKSLQTFFLKSLFKPFQRTVTLPYTTLLPSVIQKPKLVPITYPLEIPVETVVQTPREAQRVMQSPVQSMLQESKTTRHLQTTSDFDRKIGKNLLKDVVGGYGRYKRQYPIMTAEQMLKDVLGKKRRKKQ